MAGKLEGRSSPSEEGLFIWEVRGMKIVLDPGHGGRDPGAVGRVLRLKESDVNLQAALLLRERLAAVGHEVILTRSSDAQLVPGQKNADLTARAEVANRNGADCFVSIHCNSHTGTTARGFEVWTSRGQTSSDALATAIIRSVRAQFPGMYIRQDWSDGDPDKEANFAVLVRTRCPAVLVETAFLSNGEDERFLSSATNLSRMAAAMAAGIEAWGTTR